MSLHARSYYHITPLSPAKGVLISFTQMSSLFPNHVLRVCFLEPLWFPWKQTLRQRLSTSHLFEDGIPGRGGEPEKWNETMWCVYVLAFASWEALHMHRPIIMRNLQKRWIEKLCLGKFHQGEKKKDNLSTLFLLISCLPLVKVLPSWI